MYAKTYQTYSRQIFLSNIEVVPEFRYAGIGQFLLNILEQDALISRFDSIEGKYFPSNEYARTFYDKNGYEIYKDGYETYVCKQIDLDAERDEKTVDLIHKLNESISEDTSFRLSNRNFSSYSDREF